MQYKNLKNIKAENQRNRQSERLKNDITRRLLNYLDKLQFEHHALERQS